MVPVDITISLVEELQRRVASLDRVPRRGLAVRVRIPCVRPDRVEHDLLISSIGWIVDPDVDKALLTIVRADTELSEDDRPVRDGAGADLNEVPGDVDLAHELVIAYPFGARPHAWLVLVPVAPAFDDRALDLGQDEGERLDGVRLGRVRSVQGDLLC